VLKRDKNYLRQGNTDELQADVTLIQQIEIQLEKREPTSTNLEEAVDEFFTYLDDEIDETLS
jgi:hypothetical protein